MEDQMQTHITELVRLCLKELVDKVEKMKEKKTAFPSLPMPYEWPLPRARQISY